MVSLEQHVNVHAIVVNRLRDPIALLHDMSYYTPKAAQAMLEWCNDRIAKNFDVGRQNPFQFSYVFTVLLVQNVWILWI